MNIHCTIGAASSCRSEPFRSWPRCCSPQPCQSGKPLGSAAAAAAAAMVQVDSSPTAGNLFGMRLRSPRYAGTLSGMWVRTAGKPGSMKGVKRIWRYIFNGLAVLSLLLCVAAVVLCGDERKALECVGSDSRILILSERGSLGVRIWEGPMTPPPEIATGRWIYWPDSFYRIQWSSADAVWFDAGSKQQTKGSGFVLADWLGPWNGRERWVTVPCWALVIAFAVWPGVRWCQIVLRHGKGVRGLCRSCGYDLRASLRRCPECGRDRYTTVTPLPAQHR